MFGIDSSIPSLESILEDPTSDIFKEFASFLHQSYCIENLAFWLATQEYHQECRRHGHHQLCEKMISLYIRPNSPQEINIPCDMRQAILDDFNQHNYHFHLFDDAAEAVLELMRVNSFLPWTTSSSSSSSSTCSTSPPSYSFETHKSWPVPPPPPSVNHKKKFGVNNSPSTNSLTTLSPSFSFSDKWNLTKLKQLSRRSCSSLDYSSIEDDRLFIESTLSVTSATTTSGRYHYKTMLKRVKRSLLGQSSTAAQDKPIDMLNHGICATNTASSWNKSQH